MKLQDLLEEVSAEEYKRARDNRENFENNRKEREKSQILVSLKKKITNEMREGNDVAYLTNNEGSELFDNKDLESKLRNIYQDFVFSVRDLITGKKINWTLKTEMPLIQKKEGLVGKFFRKAGEN